MKVENSLLCAAQDGRTALATHLVGVPIENYLEGEYETGQGRSVGSDDSREAETMALR